jgi:hypothetical protein
MSAWRRGKAYAQDLRERILSSDVRRLVFIDETWTKTNMTRRRGRAPRGRRLIGTVPYGHVWTPAPVQEEFHRIGLCP